MTTIATRPARKRDRNLLDPSDISSPWAEKSLIANVIYVFDHNASDSEIDDARQVLASVSSEMMTDPDAVLALAVLSDAIEASPPTMADVSHAARQRAVKAGVQPQQVIAYIADVAEKATSWKAAGRLAEQAATEIREAHAKRLSVLQCAEWVAAIRDGRAQPGSLTQLVDRMADVAMVTQERMAGEQPAQTITTTRGGRQWRPFPVNALPSCVRDYCVQTAEGMSADPVMVALPMLAGLASAIGNTRTIRLKPDWEEPAIVWSAIVSESGSAKTPTIRKALQFITEREQEIEQDNNAAFQRYESERVVHETQLAAWKQAARRARGGADEAPPVAPTKPPRTAYVVSDTTIEAVAAILADNPRGVLLKRDELSGWYAGFDRYKSGGGRVSAEVGHWLSMHTAEELRVDRKSSGRVYVPRANLSIAGGIPPTTLTQAIGHEHLSNGLLARFLIASPPRRPKKFNTATADFMVVDGMRQLFATLYTLSMRDGQPTAMSLSSDGEREWEAFYDEHGRRQSAASGALASMLSKIEGAAARLALIVHVCRQATTEPTLQSMVDAESIRRGVTLARWFADEWQRVYEATVGTQQAPDHEGELLAWIDERGGKVAVREIGQRNRRYRDTAVLERTINSMVHDGRLEAFSVRNEHGGRPAHWVRLPSAIAKPR